MIKIVNNKLIIVLLIMGLLLLVSVPLSIINPPTDWYQSVVVYPGNPAVVNEDMTINYIITPGGRIVGTAYYTIATYVNGNFFYINTNRVRAQGGLSTFGEINIPNLLLKEGVNTLDFKIGLEGFIDSRSCDYTIRRTCNNKTYSRKYNCKVTEHFWDDIANCKLIINTNRFEFSTSPHDIDYYDGLKYMYHLTDSFKVVKIVDQEIAEELEPTFIKQNCVDLGCSDGSICIEDEGVCVKTEYVTLIPEQELGFFERIINRITFLFNLILGMF